MRRGSPLAGLLLISLVSCSFPSVTAGLREESPDPDLGRPVWVTAPADFGSVVGGAVGGVASIALLPIMWPLSLVAEDELGQDRDEFLFAPVSIVAGTGHFLFGAPLDTLDWTFRRAWVEDDLDRRSVSMQAPPLGPAGSGAPLEPALDLDPADADPEQGAPGEAGPTEPEGSEAAGTDGEGEAR